MWKIFQMWEMMFYFRRKQQYLADIHKVGTPDIDEIRLQQGEWPASIVEAYGQEEKTIVAEGTLKKHFVLELFVNYLFTRERRLGYISTKVKDHDKHVKKVNEIFLNCMSNGFLEKSNKYNSYVFITLKGEQFSTFPIGLLREWAIYLKPFGFAFGVFIIGAVIEIWRFLSTGTW